MKKVKSKVHEATYRWEEIATDTYRMLIPEGTLFRYAGGANTIVFVPFPVTPIQYFTTYPPAEGQEWL